MPRDRRWSFACEADAVRSSVSPAPSSQKQEDLLSRAHTGRNDRIRVRFRIRTHISRNSLPEPVQTDNRSLLARDAHVVSQ